MAGDNVDRNTAQAEMDAYLQNPNDWACEYMWRLASQIENYFGMHLTQDFVVVLAFLVVSDNRVNGYNVDYLTLNSKQITLTLTWAAVIVPLLGRGIFCAITGDNYWAIFFGR